MKPYYPNLSGLRFVAAAGVVIAHIEQIKKLHNIENIFDITAINMLGSNAVSFFFVLSGFLVTKSFLAQEYNGTFNARTFFLQRSRRIWPLYYLAVIIAFIFVPGVTNLGSLPIFLAFLPNISGMFYANVYSASHLWYLAVDQQFYLVYPALMKWARKALIPITLAFIIGSQYLPILKLFPFELPLIGVIGALIHERKSDYFAKLAGSVAYRIAMLFLVGYMVWVGPERLTAAFIALAVLLAAIVRPMVFEAQTFKALGRISLGVYVFHPIVITSLLWFFKGAGVAYQVLVYTLTFAITLAIAAMYHYIQETYLTGKRVVLQPSQA